LTPCGGWAISSHTPQLGLNFQQVLQGARRRRWGLGNLDQGAEGAIQTVIPAKAGTGLFLGLQLVVSPAPAFAGVTAHMLVFGQ
jgi:hypothetical protein